MVLLALIGSCIDLIMTNSMYVLESGILNDFVSDHYSIFCVRKKKKKSNVKTGKPSVIIETSMKMYLVIF